MGFRINTNVAALNAKANSDLNSKSLDQSLARLSSGLRINSAADDASGMAIADSLRSQAATLGQAINNGNDALGILQTADKAMDEQLKILDTIKTKATQAAQDGQSLKTRTMLQADINRLMEELDNIANTTSFNGKQLLSGGFTNQEFQIGASSNQTIKATIGATQSSKIGVTRFETGAQSFTSGVVGLTIKNYNGIEDFKLFVFFAIILFWGYFSFPIEILQIKEADGAINYGYTPNAQAYIKSYFITLLLTACSAIIGVVVGFSLAILRFSKIKVLNFIIDEYIDIIRGTPVILQLMIFAFVIFTFIDNLYAAIFALGLNSSAYIAEIVRSGINSVDKGQMEAARAMGLDYKTSMKEIILPQATKNILPALANEFISLFKETSVVGFISVIDITMQSQSLQAVLYNPKPLIFTGLVYYVSVKIFSYFAKKLELRMSKND